jgi:hypothetical protein
LTGGKGRKNEKIRDCDTVHKMTTRIYTIIYGAVLADAQACFKWRAVNLLFTQVIARQ